MVTQYSDERGAELRELFFESAQDLLQSLNDEALKLEKRPGDLEVVRSIRRIVHTLKGDAAACGYRELSDLAHQLEDALAPEVAAHATLAEVAFTAADTFAAMLGAYRKKSKLPSTAQLTKLIRDLTVAPSGKKTRTRKKTVKSIERTTWSEYEMLAAQHAAEQGRKTYHVTAQMDPRCAMPIAGRQLVLNALGTIGEVVGTRPEANSAAPSRQVEFLLATDRSEEQVVAKASVPTVVSQVKAELIASPKKSSRRHDPVEPGSPPQVPEPEAIAAPVAEASSARPNGAVAPSENILRVDAERIDSVLNLVGELIIGKSMLQQALQEFARQYPKEPLRGRFADAMAFQARVLNDLQRSVMKIRMVPVEQLFRRFPRMVRDVALHCGREVELVISGQDTDLDKSILDTIAEPLTHLVRNAVGHGIEKPEERKRLGKPAKGTIRLDTYHQGSQVIVEVHDDGRGIDVQRVRAKAIESGLLRGEDAARLSEAEILEFVFRPGFSTAEEITEIAGRGVGLDVVQSVVRRIKGTVQVETRPGEGTTFRLKLPLTLAIIKALLFRVEERLYAIPLNAVAEIARSTENAVHQVDNIEVLQMRNQVVPLVRLGRTPQAHADDRSAKIFVLVIRTGEKKLGLIVDSLAGEEELVIKALDDQTVATDLVSGASILGDGRVVLILSLPAVIERHGRSRTGDAGRALSGLLLSQSERAHAAGVQP